MDIFGDDGPQCLADFFFLQGTDIWTKYLLAVVMSLTVTGDMLSSPVSIISLKSGNYGSLTIA